MVAEVVERHITWRGGNLAAYNSRDPEILVEGPAGTGKTFMILTKLHDLATEHPGFRGLIMRKTAVTLASTCLRTLEEEVFTEWDKNARRSVLDGVHYYGGSEREPASYVYDNGSSLVVGGMDQASKVLSSAYDVIYVNEVTELDLEDWETLTTRARKYTIPNNRCIGDCNPSYDRHWALQRCLEGRMRRIRTTLKDNPAYFTDEGEPTERGAAYMQTLEGLTGTRRQRLLEGEWVGMENAIYADALNAETMFVELPERPGWTGRGWGGMDFGRIHLSAVVALTESHDGRLWVRECWTGHNDRAEILAAARRHRERFGVKAGVTDPLQDWAAQDLGWKIASSGAGSRKGRIQRVLGLLENDQLRFDRYGEGVQELWDEMHMYRYEVKETDTSIDDVVVRKDDDRVAALEYAVEAALVKRLERRPEMPSSRPRRLAAVGRHLVG